MTKKFHEVVNTADGSFSMGTMKIPDLDADKIYENIDCYFSGDYLVSTVEKQVHMIIELQAAMIKANRDDDPPTYALLTSMDESGQLRTSAFQPPYELYLAFDKEGRHYHDEAAAEVRKSTLDSFKEQTPVTVVITKPMQSVEVLFLDGESKKIEVPEAVQRTCAERVAEMEAKGGLERLSGNMVVNMENTEGLIKVINETFDTNVAYIKLRSRIGALAFGIGPGGERHAEMALGAADLDTFEEMAMVSGNTPQLPRELRYFMEDLEEILRPGCAKEGFFN